jgi:hypothetical protein
VCCVSEQDDGGQPDLTPEINLAKGLLGRRGSAIIQYIQDFHRRRGAAYEKEVRAASGMEPDDIAALIGGSEPLAEILESGWDAAARTASDYRIRLLANVAAQALTDPARIDIAELRMQTFRELTEQQVHALMLLAVTDEQRPVPNAVEQMIDASTRYKGPRTWPAHKAASRALSGCGHEPDVADAITAALERHGLIWNDPAGLGGWGLTDYGRHIVRFLREVGPT